ncbi:hypothetical protein C1646_80990 [Rhizophagus diaphanus]|nr:hypothetical protein C1646_80990 [Rhizophagus diaphanus] [Rhizophagus sp. MUCL 43196]
MSIWGMTDSSFIRIKLYSFLNFERKNHVISWYFGFFIYFYINPVWRDFFDISDVLIYRIFLLEQTDPIYRDCLCITLIYSNCSKDIYCWINYLVHYIIMKKIFGIRNRKFIQRFRKSQTCSPKNLIIEFTHSKIPKLS